MTDLHKDPWPWSWWKRVSRSVYTDRDYKAFMYFYNTFGEIYSNVSDNIKEAITYGYYTWYFTTKYFLYFLLVLAGGVFLAWLMGVLP